MKAAAYLNLSPTNKKNNRKAYSLKRGGVSGNVCTPKDGVDFVIMSDIVFHVQPGSVESSANGHKVVHAFVVGEVTGLSTGSKDWKRDRVDLLDRVKTYTKVGYNPKVGGYFWDENGTPVQGGDKAILLDGRVYVKNPQY